MLKTLLRTNTVYIFAIQLMMVLVANHVICTDFNYSYFLSCLSNASVNWLLQSHGKVPSPDPLTYFYSVLPPQHLLLLGLKDVLPRTYY